MNLHLRTAMMVGVTLCLCTSTARSEQFADGFEAPEINPFWNVSLYAGPEAVELTADPARSGAQSVALRAYAGQGGGGGLWHVFGYDAIGSASVWIYDTAPGVETRYCHLTLYNVDIPYGEPGSYLAAGVEDWGPSQYFVTDPSSGHQVASGVPRTAGWHHFEIIVRAEGGEYRIDGAPVLSFHGSRKFNSVNLEVFGPSWRPAATFYFDDLSIEAVPTTSGVLAASRFDQHAEGWFLGGDPTSTLPVWQDVGGNPGGCIEASDEQVGAGVWFHAPARYLGDRLSVYGGTLSFDLQQDPIGSQYDSADVRLIGANMVLVTEAGPNPAFTPEWSTYAVSLSEADWHVGTLDSRAATLEQFQAVLGDLNSLQIRGEFSGGADVTRLDNVVLSLHAKPHAIAPYIVHGTTPQAATIPCSGMIDPRMESSDGSSRDQGVATLQITFSEPVYSLFDAEPAGPADFTVSETGGEPAPSVVAVIDLLGTATTFELHLDRPLTPGAWTTVQAHVQGATGLPVSDLGNLGQGQTEPDRIDVGFLPGDIDQNGTVEAIDLLRFRQYLSGTCGGNCPTCGGELQYYDIDRNGQVEVLDLLRYRQLLTGSGQATQTWLGQALNAAQP